MFYLIFYRMIFENPYYPSGIVIARCASNIAVILWSGFVLAIPDGLSLSPYWPVLVSFELNEDYVAAAMLIIASVNMFCLLKPCRPRKIGILGYCLFLGGWATVFLSFIWNWPHIQVTATALTLVAVGLAFFSVVGGPRKLWRNNKWT